MATKAAATADETNTKAVANLANEGAGYLKSIKRNAQMGTLNAKVGAALIEMARGSLDAIETKLKKGA